MTIHYICNPYAVIRGRFNITVNLDYLHAQNQGKLASVCLQRFLSIFETTIMCASGEILEKDMAQIWIVHLLS